MPIVFIAFITDAAARRDILAHLGESIPPPRIAPARGPPLWEAAGAEHDLSADARHSSSTNASPLNDRRRSPVRRRACSRRRPRASPRATTLASAPARKYDHKHAEQPIAPENRRLTHLTDPTTISLASSRTQQKRSRMSDQLPKPAGSDRLMSSPPPSPKLQRWLGMTLPRFDVHQARQP